MSSSFLFLNPQLTTKPLESRYMSMVSLCWTQARLASYRRARENIESVLSTWTSMRSTSIKCWESACGLIVTSTGRAKVAHNSKQTPSFWVVCVCVGGWRLIGEIVLQDSLYILAWHGTHALGLGSYLGHYKCHWKAWKWGRIGGKCDTKKAKKITDTHYIALLTYPTCGARSVHESLELALYLFTRRALSS